MAKALALGLAVILAGTSPVFANQDGDARQGQAIAEKYCAICHAIGTSGDSPKAKAIAFRDLHNLYPIDNLDEALGEGLVINHPDMPEITLTVAQIFDFKAFLKGLNK